MTSYKKELLHYAIGGVGALSLTLLAFWLVSAEVLSGPFAAFVVLVLAGIQATVQLVFFLHLGSEAKPRWKSYSVLFTTLMLLVVVVGSLWIMMNLNYNMGMSGEDMNEFMIKQNKKGF